MNSSDDVWRAIEARCLAALARREYSRAELAAHVARLTALAASSGLNGVVCSAHEAGAVKAAHGRDFLTVTPGIRPAGSSADDQTRTMTPAAALQAGSDYLVIGRPVTRAEKPAAALADIITSIKTGA